VTTHFVFPGTVADIDETAPDEPCHPATVLIVEAADSLTRIIVAQTVLRDRRALLCVARPIEISDEVTDPQPGRPSYHIAKRLALARPTN